MSTHTPGPWRTDRHPSGEYVIDALNVGEYGIGFFALREDAQLAAAAPDLLELALQIDHALGDGYDMPESVRRLLPAAIAKATGS